MTDLTLREELTNALTAQSEIKEEKQEITEVKEVKEVIESEKKEENQIKEEIQSEEEFTEEKINDVTEKEFVLIPKEWSKEEQSYLEGLLNSTDPEKKLAAEVLIDRYNSLKKGFHEKTQKYSNDLKEYKPISEIFKPIENNLKQAGLSKAQYVQELINYDKAMGQNPIETIKQLMGRFNVKPQDLGAKQFDDFDDDLTEDKKPDTSKIEAELQALKTQLSLQPIMVQIEQFQTATNSEGKLLHPHFEQARTTMAAIMQTNADISMENAYKKALIVLDIEQAEVKTNTQSLKERIAQVEKAQKASKRIKANSDTISNPNISLKDELLNNFNKYKR
jgi:hypothetical protein